MRCDQVRRPNSIACTDRTQSTQSRSSSCCSRFAVREASCSNAARSGSFCLDALRREAVDWKLRLEFLCRPEPLFPGAELNGRWRCQSELFVPIALRQPGAPSPIGA